MVTVSTVESLDAVFRGPPQREPDCGSYSACCRLGVRVADLDCYVDDFDDAGCNNELAPDY